MIIRYKNRVLSNGNYWTFELKGVQFPLSQIDFYFSSPSSLVVDYGDGAVVTYTSGTANRIQLSAGINSNASALYPAYFYTTGDAKTLRTVKLKLLEPAKLIKLYSGYAANVVGVFPARFSQTPNLDTLSISAYLISGIDETYLLLRSIRTLSLRNVFQQGTRYYGIIPVDVINNKSYISFGYSSSLGGKRFSESNLDKIAPALKNTLTTLAIDSNKLQDQNGVDGGLPENFAELTQLVTLNLNSNLYTVPPVVLNTMLSLTTLSMSQVPLVSWGNLSALVKLGSFTVSSAALPPVVPAYLAVLTKLKAFRFSGAFGGPENAALFISSFYEFVIANAVIVGASSLPFRDMTITAGSEAGVNSAATGHILTGSYQPPVGYVQGSANGSPASTLEMIYVLEKQYAHNWSYRTA